MLSSAPLSGEVDSDKVDSDDEGSKCGVFYLSVSQDPVRDLADLSTGRVQKRFNKRLAQRRVALDLRMQVCTPVSHGSSPRPSMPDRPSFSPQSRELCWLVLEPSVFLLDSFVP
jgi:hypothetical protein